MGGAGWQQGAAATSRANLRGGGEADSLRGKPHPTVEGRGGTGSWGFGKCVGRAIPSPAPLHPVTQTTFRAAPAEVGSPHSTSLPGAGSSQTGVEGLAPRVSTPSLSFLLPSLPPLLGFSGGSFSQRPERLPRKSSPTFPPYPPTSHDSPPAMPMQAAVPASRVF